MSKLPGQQRAQATTQATIVALIPARNEADRIGATVGAVLNITGVDRVVVVDDASRDDTAQEARNAGAHVIRIAFNVGKGPALEHAARRAEDADIILLLDGDLGESATQAELLLAPVLAGTADMSIARFPKPAGKAGFGLVKNLARKAIVKAGGTEEQTQAPLSGQRALTSACLAAVRPFASGYGVEVALTVRALRQGFRVSEVPTTMSHNATGRDLAGFIHRAKQFRDVAFTLIKLSSRA